MGIPTFDADVEIISKLNDYPGADDGLTPSAFRARFDLAAKLIKEYINTILLPNINMTTDVDALISGVQKKMSVVFGVEQAKYFVKVVQLDDCVLGSGYHFNASKISDTQIRIYGGEAVIQGHLVTLNPDGPISISVVAGTYGTYRNDLVCLRFTRTADGTEMPSIVYLQGNTTQGEASDPAYLHGDINVVTAAAADFPLYRIRVQNTTATLEPLFAPVNGFLDMLANDSSIWKGGSF